MRYFSLLDFQHFVLATAIGLILLIGVYIAWRGYPRDREPIDEPNLETRLETEPESQHHPVAPLLVLIYAGTVLWLIGYLLLVGVFGGPIT